MVRIHENMQRAQQQKPSMAEQQAAVEKSLAQIKHKILVMSGKGGVGKSSTSVNLSIALARKGHRVGIMDVDLHGPDVPRMLGLGGMMSLSANQKLAPQKVGDNLSVVSIEALIAGKDDAIIWRGPMKYTAIQQFISQVEWGPLDYLIIDAPPGTGDEPLTVAQIVKDARAIIVTTPQEVALADVRKSINFCRTVKMEIFGLIENMSGFACPHCNSELELFGTGGGEQTAKASKIEFLGRIPFDPNMVACADSGKCFRDNHTDSAVARAFDVVAERLGHLSV